ncbi:protein dopey-2 isoform X2 [Pseudonaja textilis]|uniref:protein dopey-2 isoform X2 n=1 Tax=Pseudonaja textilis TaxID=8673 RepID=UPI000EA95DAC|nr:protein dopey-2 isoform X2 [Pseudonaja textilis]
MDPEEQELLGDHRYRNYSSAIDKALRNFESSSEWADLISSLGKLNKALQSNLKYSLLPRRLIISKRLSQCLHPALPTGVHIKALESYEVIFKIIGTKWLAKDLFLYSSGLFPLLGVAALSVKPVLLDLYENYFLPLQKSLLPSLQAFLIGLLPGLEEGSEFYDRTDALLVKLSLVIGKEVFYSALWASVLVSPSVRLPASLFVVSHINRAVPGKQQNYMMGTDANLTIQAICVSMLDSNVLVQRNTLEVVLFFFPLYSSLDPNESAIPLHRSDVVHLLSAAAQTLLRRDMSLNRRLYSWLLGSDIKGRASVPELSINTSLEDYAHSFFEKYSKELLVEGLIEILHQKFSESDLEEQHHAYLKPFRILISLLDKPEIGPLVIADLFLEVIRAFYRYCKETLGSDLKLNYSQTGNVLTSVIKENKNASEIVKTANMLITSLNTDFLWDYMTGCIEDCLSDKNKSTQTQLLTNGATISELCTLTVFLLDVIPLELYSEVQSLYLPQMLSYMVQSLLENMEVLSLSELTYVLRTCFKVLSKVQMPSAYLSTETGSSDSSPVKEDSQEISSESKVLEDEEHIPLPSIKSEDSGIALSASSPELLQHLRIPRIIPDKDDVWKKGGSMQMTLHYIQELVAKFASKHIFEIHLQNSNNDNVSKVHVSQGNNKEGNCQVTVNTGDKRHSYESRQIVVPQLKRMLSDFFTVRGSPFKQKGLKPCSPSDECDIPRDKEEKDWDPDQVTFDLGATREDCREAFSALCYLLLDCTTFPVYLSEEESELLYLSLFQVSGDSESSFPLWLKSLMTICCCVNDCYIQNLTISVLLEVINHSQSLALVIEDRIKRYKIPGQNPFFGGLQMVTIPPIAPGSLKLISEKTDFYQRVAQVLWNQLNKETREHHNTCVELFYRLHCLAPSANICEDIICHALLDHDKCMRLEALFRFSIMWHLTREIQGSRTTSHSRSFDRSLFVVLDSLNYSDGAISAAAQGWLIRALSLNDVTRILEPALLLLLHPKTQRISLHCIKQKNSTDMSLCYTKKTVFQESVKSRDLCESSSEETLPLSQFTVVDREAIWAEVEKDPEKSPLKNELSVNKPSLYAESVLEMGKDESEHTESADTSTGPLDSDNTSSFSPSLEQQDLIREENNSASTDGRNSMKHTGSSNVYPADSSKSSAVINLVRTDSDRTRASESLSSDDEMDLELQTLITSRLQKQQKEKQELVEALFKHVLLYIQPYDSKRVLYAFSVLEGVLKTNPKEFIEAVASTSMDTSSTAHLNLIYNLLARHQESLVGQSFYGKLQIQSPTMCPHSLLIELLMYLCLSFLRSYYPCYLKVTHKDVLGNRDVQVKSVEVLIRMVTQLTTMVKSTENKNIEFIRNLLERCKIQEFVLLSLSASMYTSQKCYEHMLASKANGLNEHYILEESLINFGHDQIWSEQPLQIELLKLLQVLIVLEHHLGQTQEEQENQPALTKEWQRALSFQEAINAVQYVHPHSITSQGLFVSAVVRGLQPEYGYGMHPSWVGLVTYSLPYFGKSLGWTVAPFIVQICKNLDELVNQYEHEVLKMSTKISASINYKRENITPDYPLTLLEGLTTIGHFCLLDHPNQTKKSRFNADPTSLKNARNAILEELPQIINTMSLLWNVIKKEDSQKRPSDFLGIKSCSSIYFKATKILKNKILDFLNPLTGQLGVQLIAATAAVWSSKKPYKYQTKMSPKANTSQLILVDLICALSTLKTDIILQLIKEVVKKPSQIKGEEKSALVDIPVLQFCNAFIQRLPVSALQENFQSLLGVFKESVQLNLASPGHFLLLSTLNDFVTRTPNQENKKNQKDLQDVTQKILEAVGNVAASSLEQTSWLSRNLEVKAQSQISLEEPNVENNLHDHSTVSSVVSASAPSVYSVQALTLLAEVLASLLDMVYQSDEKEKAVPLISRLLYYVFPYLRNHSAYNLPSFHASTQLLSSLSGYAYTKRAWKKEVLDLFMDPAFFQMDTSCIHWRTIIDHLLTHEKTMFKDLMNMQSSSLKLFPSFEQKAMLLKRQAFAVFSGEIDQYHLYLPLIQERLTDNLRIGHTSSVGAQMFLFFRVLLLRISPQHLTSLWPIMVTELIQTFIQLEEDLTDEPAKNNKKMSRQKASSNGSARFLGDIHQNELTLYLSACKFLDTALSFPSDKMQLFQMYRWAFVPEVDMQSCSMISDVMESPQECKPHVARIMDLLKLKYGEPNINHEPTKNCDFPLLDLHSISNITQLIPFFNTLNSAFKTQSGRLLNTGNFKSFKSTYPISSGTRILKLLEEYVENDFIDNMEKESL